MCSSLLSWTAAWSLGGWRTKSADSSDHPRPTSAPKTTILAAAFRPWSFGYVASFHRLPVSRASSAFHIGASGVDSRITAQKRHQRGEEQAVGHDLDPPVVWRKKRREHRRKREKQRKTNKLNKHMRKFEKKT